MLCMTDSRVHKKYFPVTFLTPLSNSADGHQYCEMRSKGRKGKREGWKIGNIEGNGKAASLGLDGQEDGVYEKSQGRLKKLALSRVLLRDSPLVV